MSSETLNVNRGSQTVDGSKWWGPLPVTSYSEKDAKRWDVLHDKACIPLGRQPLLHYLHPFYVIYYI